MLDTMFPYILIVVYFLGVDALFLWSINFLSDDIFNVFIILTIINYFVKCFVCYINFKGSDIDKIMTRILFLYVLSSIITLLVTFIIALVRWLY